MRSLQRTLAVRYGLSMLVALLTIALWAFVGVQRTLEQQLDRDLGNAAVLMADVLAHGEGVARHSGPAEIAGFLDEVNRLVVTRDADGRVRERNSPMADSLPLDSAAFAAALGGRRAWANGVFAGQRIRSVMVPAPYVPSGAATAARVVQVAASMRPLQAASDSVLLRMLATALIGALVTGAGAGWLARSSLEPVGEVAAQARAMSGQGGARQITAHADVVELQDLIAMLNGMLQRLDEALLQQRRIIADVGHELRTPITALRGEAEVALRAERTPAHYQALLQSMLEEIDHLGLMGDALITLSRLESGETPPAFAEIDLVALVLGRTERLRERHRGAARAITPVAPVLATVDPRLVELALDQLVENVRRHTPPGTAVQLGVVPGDHSVALVVEDAGPGVPEAQMANLFEPFFRQDAARARGGAGLGLTLVRSIVQLHGGSVTADRGPLGGLRVTLALPRVCHPVPPAGTLARG